MNIVDRAEEDKVGFLYMVPPVVPTTELPLPPVPPVEESTTPSCFFSSNEIAPGVLIYPPKGCHPRRDLAPPVGRTPTFAIKRPVCHYWR